MTKLNMTKKRWKAIENNDKNANDVFIYAVKSTMIFCKPSCKARLPKKENVTLYNDFQDAIDLGYRPCKKCNPMGKHTEEEEWCIQIKNYINKYYFEELSLEKITNSCHGSLYHLSRVFKKCEDISIMEYLHKIRIEMSMKHLKYSNLSIDEIARKVGYKTSSHYIKKFKQITKNTPKQYRDIEVYDEAN